VIGNEPAVTFNVSGPGSGTTDEQGRGIDQVTRGEPSGANVSSLLKLDGSVGTVASSHAAIHRQAATMAIAKMLGFMRTSLPRGVTDSRHDFFHGQRAMRQLVVVT
jgi:hypothetical protein